MTYLDFLNKLDVHNYPKSEIIIKLANAIE